MDLFSQVRGVFRIYLEGPKDLNLIEIRRDISRQRREISRLRHGCRCPTVLTQEQFGQALGYPARQ